MTTTATDPMTAIEDYLRFWNLDPGEEQTRLAERLFAPDVGYHAVIGTYTGVTALVELSASFVEHLGDIAFIARAEPDVLHRRARLRWEILRQDATFARGTDVIVLDEEGRIASVTVFLDRAPEGFDPHAHL